MQDKLGLPDKELKTCAKREDPWLRSSKFGVVFELDNWLIKEVPVAWIPVRLLDVPFVAFYTIV